MTSAPSPTWSVFAKPWADMSGAQLGSLLASLGFAGVEIPVRSTTFVTPERAETRLPRFVADLADHGVVPVSVAGELTESMFAACQSSGVPIIRVMAPIEADGYLASVRRFRTQLEQSAPWARQYGVRVGVQPHHGRYVSSVLGVLDVLADLPVGDFTLIWDAAHDALAGDDPTLTLEAAGARLSMVNLKNAVYRPLETTANDPLRSARTSWRSWFVEGHQGLSDWSAVLGHLGTTGYAGPVCLSAQYSELTDSLERTVARDLALAQWLHAGQPAA
jgi:sugar phosphate isomerase/epimerase